jgi:hypothetical protein
MPKYVSRFGSESVILRSKPEQQAILKLSALELIKQTAKEMKTNA